MTDAYQNRIAIGFDMVRSGLVPSTIAAGLPRLHGSSYPLDGTVMPRTAGSSDLQRHILPYFFIKYATRFLPVNRMARHDEPVSVARAFAADDWRHLLAEGGIPAERACIEWFLPFRYSVSCRKEIET